MLFRHSWLTSNTYKAGFFVSKPRGGIISVVIGGHFGGGDHFDGGDHFGGGTGPLLSYDLLLFIEEIHMNNTVAIVCSKMQNLKQIFQ